MKKPIFNRLTPRRISNFGCSIVGCSNNQQSQE